MAILDQLSVMGIVDQHHVAVHGRLMVRIKQRLTGSEFSFLLLFRLAQRFTRHPGNDYDHGNRGEETNILENDLIETGGSIGLPGFALGGVGSASPRVPQAAESTTAIRIREPI